MSDLLDNQKIHYIVKDYKRMFDGFHALVEENKELRSIIEKKDHEIATLEAFKKQKIAKQVIVQEKKLDGDIKGLLNNSLCQINSLHAKASLLKEQTEKLTKTLVELDKLIRG